MYYSEYLRNKKRAAPQLISPPQGRSSGLWTQMQRYKNSAPVHTPRNAGQVILLSSEGVIAHKGQVAICCADTIKVQTVLPPTCCDLVVPEQLPRGFYGPVKPDCCPVNGPTIGGDIPCCPDIPANSTLITWTKKPTTQG